MNSFGIPEIKPNQFQTTLEMKRVSFQFPFSFEVNKRLNTHVQVLFGIRLLGESNQIIFNPFKPFWKTPFRNTLLKSTQTFSFQKSYFEPNLILIQSQKCSISKCKLLQTFEPNFSNFCKIS